MMHFNWDTPYRIDVRGNKYNFFDRFDGFCTIHNSKINICSAADRYIVEHG